MDRNSWRRGFVFGVLVCGTLVNAFFLHLLALSSIKNELRSSGQYPDGHNKAPDLLPSRGIRAHREQNDPVAEFADTDQEHRDRDDPRGSL